MNMLPEIVLKYLKQPWDQLWFHYLLLLLHSVDSRSGYQNISIYILGIEFVVNVYSKTIYNVWLEVFHKVRV